jgi:hypothetical protein
MLPLILIDIDNTILLIDIIKKNSAGGSVSAKAGIQYTQVIASSIVGRPLRHCF